MMSEDIPPKNLIVWYINHHEETIKGHRKTLAEIADVDLETLDAENAEEVAWLKNHLPTAIEKLLAMNEFLRTKL